MSVAAGGDGGINFKILTVDPVSGDRVSSISAPAGTKITIELGAQGTNSGLLAVGGDIMAVGPAGGLDSSGQHFSWLVRTAADSFGNRIPQQLLSFAGAIPTPYYTDQPAALAGWNFPTTAMVADQASKTIDNTTGTGGWNQGGTAGANGGMTHLGSGQAPTINFNSSFGKTLIRLGTYTLTVLDASKPVTLTWVEAPLVNGHHQGYGGWFTTGTVQGDYDIGTITPLVINPAN